MQRLVELPEGTNVGIVGWGQTCMENLSRSIEGAGLEHLNFVSVDVDQSPEEVREVLGEVRAVLCASVTAQKLRERVSVPDDLEIIEEDRTLDKGGIEMLGQMLRQPPVTE